MGDTRHRHGADSYYVVGEGLLATPEIGETSVVSAAENEAAAQSPPFRFSRVGPKGAKPDRMTRRKVAEAMPVGGGGAGTIPAGFTYVGQFVDHDLTFDKTTVMLGEDVTPAQLIQARSPSLDLDSLYGAGPQDPESAKFYSDDRHLKLGRTDAVGGIPAMDGFDLPRGAGGTRAQKRKALIPEPRNDENLAVAQTHLAFARFHNRVVDRLPSTTPAAQQFATARRQVIRHYQWMVRHDYLTRICAKSVVNDVFRNGRKVFEVGASPMAVPTMPVEFSIAAFRFGHSMIRSAYAWNSQFPDDQGSLDLLFTFSATGGDLGGGVRLPSNWIADFRRLFDFTEAGRPDLTVPAPQFNRAMRLDTRLTDPLKNLPTGTFGGPGVPFDDPAANLAFRNLTRAAMVRLASGQQMVALLQSRGVTVNELTRQELREGRNGAVLDQLTTAQRDAFLTNTPLWFYVLREAELNGGRLGGLGARIVAETFHRAMEGSDVSIVRSDAWRPRLGPDNQTFRMVDLLLFAFEGKRRLLAPLG